MTVRRAAALVAALAAVAVAAALLHVPDRPLPELAARWAPPPSASVGVDGLDVHYRDEGPRDDPTPLVLLHGTSASLHTWDGWTRRLAGERRVIRLDLPGFGLTGPFPDDDYRTARYVAFLGRFLDALGVGRCVVAGNSFGGELAWNLALAAPDRVAGLVLVDAAGYPFRSESVPVAFRLARIPVVDRVLEHVLPRSAVESSVRNVYGDPGRVTRELVDRYYELALREGNRRALVERFRDSGAGVDERRIREIAVPTLILWGAEDRLIPVALAERFARDVRGSRMVVFPGLGHVPHEEDPAATVRPVREFLGLP